MKKRFLPALLGVGVLLLSASAARADGCGWGFSYSSHGSFGFSFTPNCGGGGGCGPYCPPCGVTGGSLGPWYNYWPLDAHFQTPALPQYPYWPAPQAYFQGGYAPQQNQGGYAPQQAPIPAPAQAPSVYGPGYQPYAVPPAAAAGQYYYNPYRTASYPSYWYGR